MSAVAKLGIVFLVLCVVELITASRILAIFPLPFHDHQITFRPLIENLAERGHHLTVVTTEPFSFDIENVKVVDLSFANNLKILNELSESAKSESSDIIRTVFRVMRTVAETELKSSQVQMMLRNNTESFDVVLVDWSGPSLMNGFSYYYCSPLIGITLGGAYITAHESVGNPNHPSVFPSILLPFSENLSLLQRIMSTFFTMWYRYLYFYEELPIQHEIAKDYFGSDIPELWEVESNADLLLINNYQALGNVRPVGPTTVYLGGIHANNKPNPLPINLENFLTQSTSGVIYLNLGSMTKSFMKTGRMERLISILEKTSSDIIWNTNGFTVDVNTTARIFQSSTVPQEEVLRHENVNLFVTIGGQRDIEDAIHHATPILGLAFSSNLEHYLQQIIKFEAGSITMFDRETDNQILAKIEEFSQEDKYKLNMAKLNGIIRDQPQSTLERAVWWIEYVIRNGGTPHLKHSLSKLSWFQYLLLDVFLAIILSGIAVLSALGIIVIRIRKYSKSLPFEKVTRRTKRKLL